MFSTLLYVVLQMGRISSSLILFCISKGEPVLGLSTSPLIGGGKLLLYNGLNSGNYCLSCKPAREQPTQTFQMIVEVCLIEAFAKSFWVACCFFTWTSILYFLVAASDWIPLHLFCGPCVFFQGLLFLATQMFVCCLFVYWRDKPVTENIAIESKTKQLKWKQINSLC